jgi:rhamnosyltransferase
MVSCLLAALHELQAQGVAVAGVGPRFCDPDSGNSSYFMQYGGLKYRAVYCSAESPRRIRTEFLISSGMLIPGNMVDEVGLMDEPLFIDLVDTEWCLRAADRGYRVFGVCDAVMYHSIGERLMKVWIGRWQHIPYHAPLRHYYYFRNAMLVYRRSYVPAAWRRNELVQLVYMFVVFGLTATPRVGQLRMMLRGLWDGLRGRSGQYRTS